MMLNEWQRQAPTSVVITQDNLRRCDTNALHIITMYFIIQISSHSHKKRKPQITILQYRCSITILVLLKISAKENSRTKHLNHMF